MENRFKEFIQFCEGHLSNAALITLVYKRYDDCDEEYKSSHQFLNLINATTEKIENGPDKIFVHLRDFLNELKDNKDEDCGTPKRTRDDSDDDQPVSKKTRYAQDNENGQHDSEQSGASNLSESHSDYEEEGEDGDKEAGNNSHSSNDIAETEERNDESCRKINDESSDEESRTKLVDEHSEKESDSSDHNSEFDKTSDNDQPINDQPMFIESDNSGGQFEEEKVASIIDDLDNDSDDTGKSESSDEKDHMMVDSVNEGGIFIETDCSSHSIDSKVEIKTEKPDDLEVKPIKPVINTAMESIVKLERLKDTIQYYKRGLSKSREIIIIETDSETDESDYGSMKCTCSKHRGNTKDPLSSCASDCNKTLSPDVKHPIKCTAKSSKKQTNVTVDTSDSDSALKHHKGRTSKCLNKSGEISGKNKRDRNSHMSPGKLKTATSQLKAIAQDLIAEPVSLEVSDSTCNEQSDNDRDIHGHKGESKPKAKPRIELITEKLFDKKMKEKLAKEPINKGKRTVFSIERNGLDVEGEDEETPAAEDEDNVKPSTSRTSSSRMEQSETMAKKGSHKQIKRLEDLLERIRDEIERVRERELDLDEMNDETSDYMLEDKLQKKFVKVWSKLCQLHEAETTTGRPTEKFFRYEGTRYPDVNNRIQKFVNRRKVFPDYHDIRNIIFKVNRDKSLHLRAKKIDDLAREAFTDVGNKLQQRRQQDFLDTFKSNKMDLAYHDPALFDPELKKKLEANRKVAKSSLDHVLEKYVHLQDNIGDRYEEESDDDDDDDDDDVQIHAKKSGKKHSLLDTDNSDVSDNDVDDSEKRPSKERSLELSEDKSDGGPGVKEVERAESPEQGAASPEQGAGDLSDGGAMVGGDDDDNKDLPVIELVNVAGDDAGREHWAAVISDSSPEKSKGSSHHSVNQFDETEDFRKQLTGVVTDSESAMDCVDSEEEHVEGTYTGTKSSDKDTVVDIIGTKTSVKDTDITIIDDMEYLDDSGEGTMAKHMATTDPYSLTGSVYVDNDCMGEDVIHLDSGESEDDTGSNDDDEAIECISIGSDVDDSCLSEYLTPQKKENRHRAKDRGSYLNNGRINLLQKDTVFEVSEVTSESINKLSEKNVTEHENNIQNFETKQTECNDTLKHNIPESNGENVNEIEMGTADGVGKGMSRTEQEVVPDSQSEHICISDTDESEGNTSVESSVVEDSSSLTDTSDADTSGSKVTGLTDTLVSQSTRKDNAKDVADAIKSKHGDTSSAIEHEDVTTDPDVILCTDKGSDETGDDGNSINENKPENKPKSSECVVLECSDNENSTNDDELYFQATQLDVNDTTEKIVSENIPQSATVIEGNIVAKANDMTDSIERETSPVDEMYFQPTQLDNDATEEITSENIHQSSIVIEGDTVAETNDMTDSPDTSTVDEMYLDQTLVDNENAEDINIISRNNQPSSHVEQSVTETPGVSAADNETSTELDVTAKEIRSGESSRPLSRIEGAITNKTNDESERISNDISADTDPIHVSGSQEAANPDDGDTSVTSWTDDSSDSDVLFVGSGDLNPFEDNDNDSSTTSAGYLSESQKQAMTMKLKHPDTREKFQKLSKDREAATPGVGPEWLLPDENIRLIESDYEETEPPIELSDSD